MKSDIEMLFCAGRAYEKLLWLHMEFSSMDLSKHNPLFDSDDLDEVRHTLIRLKHGIEDIIEYLEPEKEEVEKGEIGFR